MFLSQGLLVSKFRFISYLAIHLLQFIRFNNKNASLLKDKLMNHLSYFVILNKVTWHWNRSFLRNVKEPSTKVDETNKYKNNAQEEQL